MFLYIFKRLKYISKKYKIPLISLIDIFSLSDDELEKLNKT